MNSFPQRNSFGSNLSPSRIMIFLVIMFANGIAMQAINYFYSISGNNSFKKIEQIEKVPFWNFPWRKRRLPIPERTNKMYIAIITMKNAKSTNNFHLSWINRLKSSPYFDRAVYVTDGYPQVGDNQVLSIPDKVLADNVALINKTYHRERVLSNVQKFTKFNYSMYDFITNSTADWYLFIDHDGAVIPSNFNSFMENLNKEYDPLNQIIFRGSGAVIPGGVCFPGGGLGMLMSRKATIETYKIWPQFFKKMNEPEDLYLTKMVHYFKQTMLDFHMEGFTTGLVNTNDYEKLFKKNYDAIPLCPTEPKYHQCSAIRIHLNKLAFYHKITSYRDINRLLEEIGVPDEVKLIHNAYVHSLCWEEKPGLIPNLSRTILRL